MVILHEKLDEHFSEEELRTLCSDLKIDYDGLPGRAKADKARDWLLILNAIAAFPNLSTQVASNGQILSGQM